MRYLYLVFIIMLGVVHTSRSQTNIDSLTRQHAVNVLQTEFGDIDYPQNYLLYEYPNGYILIYEHGKKYIHCLYQSHVEYTDSYKYLYSLQKKFSYRKPKKELQKDNSVLFRMFKGNLPKEMFDFFMPEELAKNYSISFTRLTEYFLLYSNGEKRCEFNVPLSLHVDVDSGKYPIVIPKLSKEFTDYLEEYVYPKFK